MMNESAVI